MIAQVKAKGRTDIMPIVSGNSIKADELLRIKEDRAKAIWVSILFSEYRAVLNALEGNTVVVLDVEPQPSTDGNEPLADEVYMAVLDAVRKPVTERGLLGLEEEYQEDSGNEVSKIARLVKKGRETLNYDYMIEVANRLNKMLGTFDGWVKIVPYKVVFTELDLTKERADKIKELGERIAEMFSKLGGRAEAELRKVIFSGYREEVIDSIEGLSDHEKKFIKDLVTKPFERAALFFAYKRIGNFRRLQRRIISTIFHRNNFVHITLSPYVPVIDDYL
jgi:hypothetical protein